MIEILGNPGDIRSTSPLRLRSRSSRCSRLAVIVLAFAIAGCASTPESSPSAFELRFPRPDWWERVEAPIFHDHDEKVAFNQTKNFQNTPPDELLEHHRVVYKGCHQAIVAHPDDVHFVVGCLSTMAYSRAGDSTNDLRLYLLENYFDYDQKVDYCVNCMRGDLLAVHAHWFVKSYYNEGDYERGVFWTEKLLDARSDEISKWVQVQIYVTLAKFYLEQPMTEARRSRIELAYRELLDYSRINPPTAKRIGELTEYYELIAAAP